MSPWRRAILTEWPTASVLLPLQRLDTAPPWGVVTGFVIGALQFLRDDLCAGMLLLVVLAGVLDYVLGVRVAKIRGEFSPRLAHSGALSKMAGVALLLLVRMFEGWLGLHGMVDTRGALCTALSVSLFAVEIQSLAHHREVLGASPIPVLGALIAWAQALAQSKVPAPPQIAEPAAPNTAAEGKP